MVDARFPFADRVLGIDDERTERVLAALSTESGRQVLAALEEGPATVSELADRTDLTAQNVSYHLGKLAEADLVRTGGTRGTGGHKATVYVPAQRIVVSTATDVRRRRRRTGIVGLAMGVFLSLACLHSLIEPSAELLTSVEYGFRILATLP